MDFDINREISIKLRGSDGIKTVGVRFPTDEEWIERQAKRKVIVKQLGRGTSETIAPHNEENDAALFEKIRKDETVAVDAFEASKIVEQLQLADVDDVETLDNSVTVKLRVLGGSTVHHLKMPSLEDAFKYRASFARVFDLPYNRQEIRINLRASGDLYKRLVESTEGYVGDVPIVHQAVVVRAVLDAQEASLAEDSEANF
ncbi:MAG: hypothetical protein ABFD89_00820 [Bryobacteraceae bacterium]